MRALPKHHAYNLFLEKESQYLMVFKNKRTYSIMLGLALCGFFWGIYLLFIFPTPEAFIYKTALTNAFLLMGSISLLALFYFISAYESLTLRKVNRTIIYEYYSVSDKRGWKKHFNDFQYIQMYKDPEFNANGMRINKHSIWHFDLVGADDDLRVTIHPGTLKPFKAWQEEEAIAFAEKIAQFMEIKAQKLIAEF